MSRWEEIAKIIGGGGVMDQLPNERQGVRPGFGLEGASIRGSDLMDQLRNAERKEAMMPLGPAKAAPGLRGRAAEQSYWDDAIAKFQNQPKTAEDAARMAEQEAADYYARRGPLYEAEMSSVRGPRGR